MKKIEVYSKEYNELREQFVEQEKENMTEDQVLFLDNLKSGAKYDFINDKTTFE